MQSIITNFELVGHLKVAEWSCLVECPKSKHCINGHDPHKDLTSLSFEQYLPGQDRDRLRLEP